MSRLFLLLSVAATISIGSCLASDGDVAKVFRQVQLNAKAHKTFKDEGSSAAEKYHKQSAAEQESLVFKLDQPDDLVQLIRLCKKERASLPGPDYKHQAQTDYYLFSECFALRKLGKIHSPAALEALERVKPIESGNATVMETWSEVHNKFAAH